MEYINSTGRISRKEAEKILLLKKPQTVQILSGLIDKGLLIRVGAGRNTVYVANHKQP